MLGPAKETSVVDVLAVSDLEISNDSCLWPPSFFRI
jgi:hypothetical protein